MVVWAKGHPHGGPILSKADEMLERYSQWKKIDLIDNTSTATSGFSRSMVNCGKLIEVEVLDVVMAAHDRP